MTHTIEQRLKIQTELYYNASEQEKAAKETKEASKHDIFSIITEAVQEAQPMREKVVRLKQETIPDDLDPEDWRAREYPEWLLKDMSYNVGTMEYLITLVENPELLKYSYVNKHLKKVFSRTVAMVGATFDAEGLFRSLAHWKDMEVANLVNKAITQKSVITYTVDEKELERLAGEHPEIVPMLQQFSHPGTPQVRMSPIRQAKDEELQG